LDLRVTDRERIDVVGAPARRVEPGRTCEDMTFCVAYDDSLGVARLHDLVTRCVCEIRFEAIRISADGRREKKALEPGQREHEP
jgi:hypothetical protein